MLAYAEDVLASVRPAMPALFARQPRAEVRVRPIPPDRAASTPSSYTAGTARRVAAGVLQHEHLPAGRSR